MTLVVDDYLIHDVISTGRSVNFDLNDDVYIGGGPPDIMASLPRIIRSTSGFHGCMDDVTLVKRKNYSVSLTSGGDHLLRKHDVYAGCSAIIIITIKNDEDKDDATGYKTALMTDRQTDGQTDRLTDRLTANEFAPSAQTQTTLTRLTSHLINTYHVTEARDVTSSIISVMHVRWKSRAISRVDTC
ncbi:hypothetical protein HELRODRAFT_184028 [Helobdella robusta]|uniref:Laminin G domain-containing protein n=1 Tax=Helobdella robusta TaxID=6412 RepID=T1FKG5_HELRO|nr:hypothetical protein HELRODRAFT_184028 [Helobdella robusta]ESO09166.1 hypothetical protein HELRODRAFT_184028 [Helobdella robusta]